jgi:hypothetical protein
MMIMNAWSKDIIKQTQIEENYYQKNKGQQDS